MTAVPVPFDRFLDIYTDELVKMGYSFSGIDTTEFARFMQTQFPHFDLLSWLIEAEDVMMPHAKTAITRKITVTGDQLNVCFHNVYTGEKDALIMDRTFFREKGKLKVKHEFLVVPEEARDQDIGRSVLQTSLAYYKKMKVDIIDVVAGLSAGPYVWARHGFVATNKAEMESILVKAKSLVTGKQYSVLEAIFNAYYNAHPKGEAFPIKNWADLPFMKDVLMNHECQWSGRLDLNNPEQLRKFEEYVSRRKK